MLLGEKSSLLLLVENFSTLGMGMAAGHAVRCLAFSTDVKVNRRSLERPWDFTVNDDGSFKHNKYVKIHDYRQLKKSDYEPALEE